MTQLSASALDFLADFKRSDTDYLNSNDHDLRQAYQAGIHDLMLKHILETGVKITGISRNTGELLKFFHNMQDDGVFIDNNKLPLTSTTSLEDLIAQWQAKQDRSFTATHLFLAAGHEKNHQKLAHIVATFLAEHFSQYALTEHSNTDQLHYHVAVNADVSSEKLAQLRASFLQICQENNAAIFK